MDKEPDQRVDKQMDEETDRQTDYVWMDRQFPTATNRIRILENVWWIEKKIDVRMNEQTNKQMDG